MSETDSKDIEQNCLNKIGIAITYEQDPNLKVQIEQAGRAICKCMAEQSDKKEALYKVMTTATRAIPKFFTVARPEIIKLKPESHNH